MEKFEENWKKISVRLWTILYSPYYIAHVIWLILYGQWYMDNTCIAKAVNFSMTRLKNIFSLFHSGRENFPRSSNEWYQSQGSMDHCPDSGLQTVWFVYIETRDLERPCVPRIPDQRYLCSYISCCVRGSLLRFTPYSQTIYRLQNSNWSYGFQRIWLFVGDKYWTLVT